MTLSNIAVPESCKTTPLLRAQGMRKEGLGVYTYPSGARYEGEWRDNLKDGRGVYYYPQASRRNTC
jgi:hypothetical protein